VFIKKIEFNIPLKKVIKTNPKVHKYITDIKNDPENLIKTQRITRKTNIFGYMQVRYIRKIFI